jgi:hypothetical protein
MQLGRNQLKFAHPVCIKMVYEYKYVLKWFMNTVFFSTTIRSIWRAVLLDPASVSRFQIRFF